MAQRWRYESYYNPHSATAQCTLWICSSVNLADVTGCNNMLIQKFAKVLQLLQVCKRFFKLLQTYKSLQFLQHLFYFTCASSIIFFTYFCFCCRLILYYWVLLLICDITHSSRVKFCWCAGMLCAVKVFSSTVRSCPRPTLLTLCLILSTHMFLVGLIPSQPLGS